jgi:hypothetical protein
MANTLNNTLNKVGDAIEAVMGGAKESIPYNDPNRVYTGQTCLERFGMKARNAHLFRNEWKRDLQYTKTLVDAEYLIQSEFKVSSYEDRLKEQAENAARKEKEREDRKAAKQAEKKAKKAAKDAEKAEKAKAKEERKQRKEMIKDTEKYMHLSNPMDNLTNFNLSQWK